MAKKPTAKSARSRSSTTAKTVKAVKKTPRKKTTRLTKATTKSRPVAKVAKSVKSARPAPAAKTSKAAKAPAARPNSPKAASNGEANPSFKTHLNKREVGQYRQLLIIKRAEILGDMKSMSREALHSDSANLSHMPIHMADVGSDNYEQELMLGLVESERRLVQEINDALQRIDDGTYGTCMASGKPINKERLAAKPWAKYCIEVAREMERSGRGGF